MGSLKIVQGFALLSLDAQFELDKCYLGYPLPAVSRINF